MTTNDDLDYTAEMDRVLGAIPGASDMNRGQALRLYNSVTELDGLLLTGAPAVEIEDAVTRFDRILNHQAVPDGQQHLL